MLRSTNDADLMRPAIAKVILVFKFIPTVRRILQDFIQLDFVAALLRRRWVGSHSGVHIVYWAKDSHPALRLCEDAEKILAWSGLRLLASMVGCGKPLNHAGQVLFIVFRFVVWILDCEVVC